MAVFDQVVRKGYCVLAALVVLACSQCNSSFSEPQPAGAPVRVSSDHKDIERAKSFALSNKRLGSPVKKLSDARIQIVAGRNYMFDLELEDGKKFRVVVYEDLNGEMSVTKFETK